LGPMSSLLPVMPVEPQPLPPLARCDSWERNGKRVNKNYNRKQATLSIICLSGCWTVGQHRLSSIAVLPNFTPENRMEHIEGFDIGMWNFLQSLRPDFRFIDPIIQALCWLDNLGLLLALNVSVTIIALRWRQPGTAIFVLAAFAGAGVLAWGTQPLIGRAAWSTGLSNPAPRGASPANTLFSPRRRISRWHSRWPTGSHGAGERLGSQQASLCSGWDGAECLSVRVSRRTWWAAGLPESRGCCSAGGCRRDGRRCRSWRRRAAQTR
jgi:hypothetical protein